MGAGGGLRGGCCGTGFLGTLEDSGGPGPDTRGCVDGGGLSTRSCANRSKSAKLLTVPSWLKLFVIGDSGGDVETGGSTSCVEPLCSLCGRMGMLPVTESLVLDVGTGLSLHFSSTLSRSFPLVATSSVLRHRASKYVTRHLSMIALVLSTLSGIFIACLCMPLPSTTFSLPAPRSQIVKQHIHLNLSSSLGTLTRLSQQIHLLITFPSSPSTPTIFLFPLITLAGCPTSTTSSSTGTSASSSGRSLSLNALPLPPRLPVLFFRLNSRGRGWLTERPWVCVRPMFPAVFGLVGRVSARVASSGPGGRGGSGLSRFEAGALEEEVLLLLPPARKREDHDGGIVCAAHLPPWHSNVGVVSLNSSPQDGSSPPTPAERKLNAETAAESELPPRGSRNTRPRTRLVIAHKLSLTRGFNLLLERQGLQSRAGFGVARAKQTSLHQVRKNNTQDDGSNNKVTGASFGGRAAQGLVTQNTS